MQENITLNIRNTTNGEIPISILGNNADPMDNANASTQYLWDLTGLLLFTEQSVYIQYKSVGQPTFTSATATFSGRILQNVVNALNTLNIGSFFITTSSPPCRLR